MSIGPGQKLCPVCNVNVIQKRSKSCTSCRTLGPADSVTVRGDTAEVTATTAENVRNLDDLIRVCKIDTTEWVVERWTCQGQQQTSVPRATRASKRDKWVRPSARTVTVQMFHVKAWLVRKDGRTRTMEALRAGLVEDIRREVRRPRIVKPETRFVDGDWLFEFAPTDLHVGKLTWGDETVVNYDAAIAGDLFLKSLDFLLDRAVRVAGGKLARVLMLIGNDVSHIDSKKAQTTAGTPMDVDTRYIKIYRRIVEIHRMAVRRLLQVAPVDVVDVPGNHDELTAFHLGEILTATFESNPHVKVDNSPRLRKYYDFGVNLFGFTHGDKERVAELPLTMAREEPSRWARCTSREWHIGHLHKPERWTAGRPGLIEQDGYADKGVRIRRFASLSAHDFWHTAHAYMDRRTCEGLVFHRDAGFTADISFNVDHLTGRALTIGKDAA